MNHPSLQQPLCQAEFNTGGEFAQTSWFTRSISVADAFLAASSIGYIQVCIHVRNFGYPRTGRIFYRSSLCQQVLDPACIHDRLVHRAPLLPVAIAPHCGIQLQLKQPFFARRASRTPPSSSSISHHRIHGQLGRTRR